MDAQKLWDVAVAHNGLDVLGWDKAPMIAIENPEELESLFLAIQSSIAPPVAAGSVDSIDTNEFCDLMTELQDVHQRLGNCKPNWDALIAHIHSWGAQQALIAVEEYKKGLAKND